MITPAQLVEIRHEEWRTSSVQSYEVSSEGRIRLRGSNKCLVTATDNHGFVMACMSVNGKSVRRGLAKMVYQAFIGPIPDRWAVLHRDRNRSNCRIDNIYLREPLKMRDYAGQVFWYWTVERYVGMASNQVKTWACRCVCGTERTIRIDHLRHGLSKSCGCKTKELLRQKVAGSKHYKWKGGVKNVGSMAWCSNRLKSIRGKHRDDPQVLATCTVWQVKKLWDAANGCCAACGRKPKRPSDFHLDHDHSTGALRGFVCANCNVAIGMADDSPSRLRQLAAYLEQPNQEQSKAVPPMLVADAGTGDSSPVVQSER